MDKDSLTCLIINGLLNNHSYCRDVIGNLKGEYFGEGYNTVVNFVKVFFNKYKKVPTMDIIHAKLKNKFKENGAKLKKISNALQAVKESEFDPVENRDWLYDETKVLITKISLESAIMEKIETLQDASDLDQLTNIAAFINESVKLTWDQDLGISYVNDVEERIERLCTKEDTIPTGIPSLDKNIGGGIRRKSLFLAGGQSGVGKTLILGNLAHNAMDRGEKVVYISLEIDKDIMSQRIDTVNLDVEMDELQDVEQLMKAREDVVRSIRDKHNENGGDIYIKEFPASKTTANDIVAYLERLKTLRNYEPDMIVVDYLGLMSPIEKGIAKNSYERGKFVSEELRSVSFEYNCPIVSAVQTGRQSYGAKSVGMEDTSDSIAIVQTADVYVTLAKPPEAAEKHQLNAEVVKCRGSKEGGQFVLQIDFTKLKVMDFEEVQEREEKEAEDTQKKAAEKLKQQKQKRIGSSNGRGRTKKAGSESGSADLKGIK